MRRKADSWMNATQILKVADFDKPQRTRILEREVQKGVHEKVQGGYGKYQGLTRPRRILMIGTWVPFERGIELSAQYKVDNLLKPIFDYVPLSGDSPPPAPKHVTAASAKPRALPPRAHAAVQNHSVAPRPSFPRQTEVAQTVFPEPIYSQPPAPPMPDSDDEEVSGASDGESDGSTTQSSHSRSPTISSSGRASSEDEFG